ncbi:MAG: hypothetical protein QOI63_814 [Thermoplasmata archaeon]|nr:hypothetical protein [Thermoplasmata archaeon]
MSFLKLAVPLVVLALVPLAHAQVAPPAGAPGSDLTLTLGDLHGLVKDDNQMVVPYAGNATVDFTLKVGCLAFFAAEANHNGPLDHVDLAITGAPAWVVADSLDVEMSEAKCATEGPAGNGVVTLTGTYPFKVAPSAPGVTTQAVNLTASLESGIESAPMQLLFAVQFHPDYDVVPSIKFPYTVDGTSADFTVTVTNRGNARSMVMFEELHASTGTFSGLGSIPYDSPAPHTFQVTFKAPDACWKDAKVDFKTFSHYLLLDQRAGSYKAERTYAWDFSNGIACTPGKGNSSSKASPVGGLVLLPTLLAAAFLARRRVF